MCGIVGILGNKPVVSRLLSSLKRLEYRGYDSAGVATLDAGQMHRSRAVGKLFELEAELAQRPIDGNVGIGHTRWATHGRPTLVNAHPHMSDRVALVHNGIIENFRALRDKMMAAGISFEGETDTEVVTRLFTLHLNDKDSGREALKATLNDIEGAFALAIIIKGSEDIMYCARKGSPLVIGLGEGENYIGSDAIALSDLSNRLVYLEEGDWAEVSHTDVTIFNENNEVTERPISISQVTGALVDKGNYSHFMLKEIHEQPTVVAQTIGMYADPNDGTVSMGDVPFDLASIPRVTLIACGTSFYAAQVASYWIEQIARIPVDVDIASEFRYRQPVMTDGGLTVLISQSGETADTLAALQHAKSQGQKIATIVNMQGSSMERESDVIFPTHAGPEIGVASTKAFTCQLAVLACLSIALAEARGQLTPDQVRGYVDELEEAPTLMANALHHDEDILKLSKEVAKARDVLFLGRGTDYPIAMEGALKLKEISYIHAEGYAAGEMKHGPIALIDENVPVVVIAPSGPLFDKTVSNMQEVLARGGRIILISDEEGVNNHSEGTLATIHMPHAPSFIAPLVYTIPVQLLAYYTAVTKGTDVDQPRNLAKSVTVE